MPETYRVTTDQGTYKVTVGDASGEAAPSVAQMMGMMGRHEAGELGTSEGPPSLMQRLKQLTNRVSLTNPEQPDVAPELSAAAGPIGLMKRLIPFMAGELAPEQSAAKSVAPAVNMVGRGLETAGEKLARPVTTGGAFGMLTHPVNAAATMAAPYAAQATGSGLQRIAQLLSRENLFQAPRMAERPSFSSVDVTRIKALMAQGIPQDQAVETIVGWRGKGLPAR